MHKKIISLSKNSIGISDLAALCLIYEKQAEGVTNNELEERKLGDAVFNLVYSGYIFMVEKGQGEDGKPYAVYCPTSEGRKLLDKVLNYVSNNSKK
jgi:hypothetical protein